MNEASTDTSACPACKNEARILERQGGVVILECEHCLLLQSIHLPQLRVPARLSQGTRIATKTVTNEEELLSEFGFALLSAGEKSRSVEDPESAASPVVGGSTVKV